jgi:type I restriction enzyme M protein
MTPTEVSNFFWNIADDYLRGAFKKTKYADVILPFMVLRRIDGVLAPTRAAVRAKKKELDAAGVKNQHDLLCLAAGHRFYNLSGYDFPRLVAEGADQLATNLRHYLREFSPNLQEPLEEFKFNETIATLEKSGRLFQVVQKYASQDLGPEKIDNHAVGTAFEDLIRRFSEANNEEAGEHYTPREVVKLMARVLVLGDDQDLQKKGRAIRIADPACGTGGMLSVAKEWLLTQVEPDLKIQLFGQEFNGETYAICKSDLFLKGDEADAENIALGSTLAKDAHPEQRFEYQICNPPYGTDWKGDADKVKDQPERFPERMRPAVSDGQTLFLQHMLARMNPVEKGGGRIAIIMNGSPLFSGDAGSGTSEFRRHLLENDLVEAIIALPEQMFFNTGISTYIWLVTNRKRPGRHGQVMLVNAADLWTPMRKSLGNKRRMFSEEQSNSIVEMVDRYEESERCRIFPNEAFGYRKITVERPLRVAAADPKRKYTPKEIKAFKDGPRDPDGAPVRNAKGDLEPDSELRDTESVPLTEDISHFFTKEVLPHVPDAWINQAATDEWDNQVGKVGYELNFNRVFYRYLPPRAIEEIEQELALLEAEIASSLTGSNT